MSTLCSILLLQSNDLTRFLWISQNDWDPASAMGFVLYSSAVICDKYLGIVDVLFYSSSELLLRGGSMRIFVCIKQVPDTETRIKLSGDANKIEEAGIKWVINPYDEFAIEEAIKFKEANPSAQVTAITVGPKTRVNNALLTAMAMGADDSLLIDSNEELDAVQTAKALASAIQKEGGAHLIFAGKLSIDGSTSAVGPMLAEILKIPHVSVATSIEYGASDVTVKREAEGGTVETYKVSTPALIAANKGLNKPRFASLPGIMKAKKKPIKDVPAADLGVSAANNTVSFSHFELPKERAACKMISGDAKSQASELVKLLREEAKVL
jgi:electron transfer flavoprotein beta subunit